jgi:hypothetical protein
MWIFRWQAASKWSLALDNKKLLIRFWGEKVLLAVLVLVLLSAQISKAEPNQPEETKKQKVLRQVAQDWIRVGMKQYERSLYKQAEQSFVQAVEYQQYLTTVERKQLNNFLEKTYKAELEREHVLEQIKAANELTGQGRLGTAKSKLEKLKDSEFLTEIERQGITETLNKLKKQLNQRTTEINRLYNRSVDLYLAGQLEEARKGFIEVARSGLLVASMGKSAEDYLVKIDSILAQRNELSVAAQAEPQKKLLESTMAAIEDELLGSRAKGSLQQTTDEPNKLDRAISTAKPLNNSEISDRRENILRSYTTAVINDAAEKVQNYIEQGEFDKAEAAIETAEATVSKNREYLGDKLLRDFNNKLTELRAKIGK